MCFREDLEPSQVLIKSWLLSMLFWKKAWIYVNPRPNIFLNSVTKQMHRFQAVNHMENSTIFNEVIVILLSRITLKKQCSPCEKTPHVFKSIDPQISLYFHRLSTVSNTRNIQY